MKLLLFDIDATLILTGGAGIHALNRAFHALFNVQNAMNDIAPHGKTDPAIIREIFQKTLSSENVPSTVISTVLESYVNFLRDEVDRSETYQVLPGILEILKEMKNRSDVLLGLATGNVESGARIKLERGDLNRYFQFGGYGSDSESRVDLVRRGAEKAAALHRLKIVNNDVFVIGDTPRDIEAGREAGFRTVGVATGHYSVDQLTKAGADFSIPNFKDGRDQFLNAAFN